MIIAVLLPLILVIQVFAGRIGHSGIDADGSNALRYDYDADNLIGIKSAVLDGNTVTYIFAADACLVNRYDVTRALIRREVYACVNNIPTSTPETVIYSKKNGDVYLTFYFADNDDMSRVDGFYLFLSEDKWITVNDPDGNIFVSCYEINSRGFHNIGSEYSFMYESGSKTSQIWNSNGSGKWSEVKTAHYGVDTMRRE